MSLSSGAISELAVASKLIEFGWAVAFPFTHDNTWDLIAYKEGRTITVQVKGAEFVEYNHTVVKYNFAQYKDLDYIICHDRIQRTFYIFAKGELDKRKTVTLDPSKWTTQFNNWKRIK